MRALGVSGGWMFFEHADTAVAVDLASGDVTDVFGVDQLDQNAAWTKASDPAAERRAHLVARSALAGSVDSLRTFRVPDAVRTSVRQALSWQQVYGRQIELPVVAAAPSLVPPPQVAQAAHQALELDSGLDLVMRNRAEQLASGRVLSPRLVRQMGVYFERHRRQDVGKAAWLSWGGDAGRTWATKVAAAQDRDTSSLTAELSDAETIDYDTLRLLPRAFSIISSPHTSECDGNGSCSCGGSKASATFPSTRALTYFALGGDVGRDWANRTLRRHETRALRAASYAPDQDVALDEEVPDKESFDASVPHVYAPVPESPDLCMFCALGEMDELHQPDAVDYTQADVTPDDAHYFSETLKDPDSCEICGKGVDDTLHKQAALASYYLYKDDVDKRVAETQEYWDSQQAGQPGQPEQPVTSAAQVFGVDWEEFDLDADYDLSQVTAEDEVDLGDVFWERRGSEDTDPMTYYVANVGDDPLTVDQIYVSDGRMFFGYNPWTRSWEQTSLGSPEQIYEIDDESARSVLRALSIFPEQPVNLREVDPAETLLMQECIPGLDHEMLERTAIVSATGVTFDYTPEERAQNAGQQVRDANGRFAKSGSRVATGADGKLGTIGKIDKATQQVEVTYDDGQSAWVDANEVKILAGPDNEGQPAVPSQIDISKIEGKPRATANTPKALLPSLLPVMDAAAINAVIENYPNFIEKERAGAAAREAARDANDEASRRRYEQEQARAEADYRRRLEKIHGRGQSARDWVDRIYRQILPAKYRRGTERIHQDAAALLAAGKAITDPAQSDVAPVYMAEVDEANQQAVLELLALVPASTEGNETQVLRYTATGWVSDPKILRQLKSSSPPAIVSLDEAAFNDTLAQVKTFYTTPEGKAQAEQEAKEAQGVGGLAAAAYGEYGELLAAGIPGIADTPSDIAATEKLKRYWTIGIGGTTKVRWNTPGDMTRCMKHLRKYMPRKDMYAGYCANLHHLMTGTWPGDRGNVGRRGSAASRGQLFDAKLLSSAEVIDFSALVAASNALCAGVEAPSDVSEVPQVLSGAPFRIPIVAPIGVKSGDGRKFAPLSLTTRELPLPLMWQIQTAEGHDDAVIVGRIDSMDRDENGSLTNARGVFDVGPYGQEAERLVRHKFLRGVSVDLDEFEAEARSSQDIVREVRAGENTADAEQPEDEVVRIVADDMLVTNGRVMGVTLVAKPAFQECTIELEENLEEEPMVADGTYIGSPDTESETEEMIRSALTAAGIPLHPPREWFNDPELKTETPLTISDDGQVYGHIATWNSDHIGLPFSTRPPRSHSSYAYFHTGLLRTANGNDVPVGQITLAGGHASLEADAAMAVKHYDDTASAMCDVHAGEDAHGIWVAGALRPNVTGEQVRAIRAAAPSGDWRPINGRLELVAVCQVNVPGFPVTRARVASGHVYALVAAGTASLYRLQTEADNGPLNELLSRVEALEAPKREALNQAREAALARVTPTREERQAQRVAAREAAMARFNEQRSPAATEARRRFASLMSNDNELFRDIGTDKRKEMAKKGQAMPDGQYPISTVGDLKNAIRAYGRAASGEKAKVRRHIKKRARALGKTDLIPESWASLSNPFDDLAGEISDMTERLTLISSGQYTIADPEAAQLASLEALFGRGPGWVTNPEGTRKLHAYWVKGEGAAKIGWGTDGDFARCEKLVGEKIAKNDPGKLRFIKNICAQWHKDATGATPGNAPGESSTTELLAAGGRYPDGTPWNPQNHPRDEKGQFRQVIAELKSDLEGEAGTGDAVEGLAEVEAAAGRGDTEAAQQAAKDVLDLVDSLATNTEDKGLVKTLREGYGNLAEAVANLPLVFGDLNEKYRFSDLPPDLKSLVEDLYKRAESRLDGKNMEEAGGKLKEFMAGGDVLSQPEISAELSRILRYLI